ncbi:MAG TPA: flagellar assembly protein FliW [Clostridia bacterium]|nr:flagellar assembly protein FliW [Clostridia bacterium]
MKIATSRFGEIEVDPEQFIRFNEGLLGFDTLKSFTLLPVDNSQIFTWMQSTEEPQVAFLLADPFVFFADYAVDLEPALCEALDISSREDLVIQSIVTIPKTGVKDMTANLVGPVVINVKNRTGKQVVISHSGYTTKHRLFKEIPPENDSLQRAGEA